METKYSITYYYDHGRIEHETAPSEADALRKVSARIKEDPECCANILVSEYEKETPNKSSVKILRYENKKGLVTRVPY